MSFLHIFNSYLEGGVSKSCFVMADLIRHLILSTGYQCRMRSRVKPGMTGQCIMTRLLLCLVCYNHSFTIDQLVVNDQ